MNKKIRRAMNIPVVFAAVLLLTGSGQAAIDGISGPSFNLTAKVDHISTADGGSILLWGYADDGDQAGFGTRAQYPAPTMIVNKGDLVTIKLKNGLSVTAGAVPNVSIVFPGQEVTASCSISGTDTCPPGTLTMEAETDGDEVTYTFTADHAGTYMYHSGTNPGLQVEMGLTGALIVRPVTSGQAYGHADTAYDYEELFFLTEMDPRIHAEVEFNGVDTPELQALLDNYVSNYWFINGRTAPDNFSESYVNWLPTQPYKCVPRMHPGDKLLMRVVGGGRDMHPFHHHGEHASIKARDGRMLESAPGMGPDLAVSVFTTPSIPGKTSDAIFEWTGEGLNWDIYGGEDVWPEMAHTCNGLTTPSAGFDPVTNEYCPDHGKPFPVVMPEKLDTAFGGWWSGSPYLGSLGDLPPGEGGLNPNGGFSFMWHSHTEKELTNYDIFPGGMLTMMIIEAYNVPIE
ncbi:MAG: multicopper oxidase domain-containing protein [Thermodesulfobacteriota bacterium]|nr:multicopper oxidase domain-containing protein [Thermodesulfobacteriota bacterium]